jgi:hypothetical protein
MKDKMKKARFEALSKMSKDKSGDLFGPKVGEKMKAKRLSKVTVMAEDEKGLAKGLTKAQQILKAKLGDMFDEKDEDEEDEGEYSCPACEDEGCEMCEEEDAE